MLPSSHKDYELVTVSSSGKQDSNLRALASKASEINLTPLLPELFVGLPGFEPRLKQSKCFVLTVTL